VKRRWGQRGDGAGLVYRVFVGLALWLGFGLGGVEMRDGGGRDGTGGSERG